MKTTLMVMFLFFFSINLSMGQVYHKGNIVIDAYYGFPNLMFNKWNSYTSQYQEFSNARATSLGPVGGRVEYLITERIGIGLEGSYANTIIDYDFKDANASSSDPYEVTITRFRILPRFNYHFGKFSKADPYITGGIGYYNRTIVFSPNNPAYGYTDPNTYETFGPNWPFSESLLLPIAFTARFGFRYFFNERVGLAAEAGFGGPALTLGLTGKF